MINEIKSVIEKHKEHIPVKVMAEILAVMDEAEVCEWKGLTRNMYNAHERFVWESVLKEWDFCPYCGKPIKISEVE